MPQSGPGLSGRRGRQTRESGKWNLRVDTGGRLPEPGRPSARRISGGAPTRPVLVVSLQSALRLTALRDLESLGVKVLISPAAGNRLIAIDADGIAVTDGGVEIVRGQPDLHMNDAPDNPSTSATVMTSLWQRNLTAVRVERYVSWIKRADAVAYLTLA